MSEEPIFENTNRTTFGRFTQNQWSKVEKKYKDVHTPAVLDAICTLGGSGDKYEKYTTELKTVGEELYISTMRPLLVDYVEQLIDKKKTVKTKKKSKTDKKKKGMTKEEIIIKNTLSKVDSSTQQLLTTLKNSSNSNSGFTSTYIEQRMIVLMHHAKSVFEKGVNNQKVYDLIIGIRKTLKIVGSVKNVSSTAIADLEHWLIKIQNMVKFKMETVFSRYPKLCISNSYNNLFPTMMVEPYDSQKQLMDSVKNNKSCLTMYRAMIGTGKTTVSIALVKYVESLRTVGKATNSTDANMQVIFACSVEPVRHQVCMMAYNKNIPFGIGTLENSQPRVTNNYNCSEDKNRLLIVADLDSTLGLLNLSQNYILFLDEPTVGADTPNDPVTNAVVKIIRKAPAKTILSSATLPEKDSIPSIVEHFKHRHPESVVVDVYSKEAMIGCEVVNTDGTTVTPHSHCTNVDELKLVIKQLKTKPFIDRLYTAPVVYRLKTKIESFGVPTLDLEEYFSDPDRLCQTHIQNVAIMLLETLATTDDNTVRRVCGNKPADEEYSYYSDDEVECYDTDSIFTTSAHKFTGQSLIVTDDPVKFVSEKSQELLEKTGMNSVQISRVIKKYKADIEKYNASVKSADKIKNMDERTKKIQSISKPVLELPESIIINSAEHTKMFSPTSTGTRDTVFIDLDISSVSEWVYILLYSGIGVYTSNRVFGDAYNDIVLDMASSKQLAFLVSDDTVCYGANYPFSHVVVEDSVAERHSIGTVFQLLGRAGRVGSSWVAYGHIGSKTATRIKNYIVGEESVGVEEEAVNMENTFKKITESSVVVPIEPKKPFSMMVVKNSKTEETYPIVDISKVKKSSDGWTKVTKRK